jgi:hypothetical protein
MLDSEVHTRPTVQSAARTIGIGALTLALAYLVLAVGRPLLVVAFGQADDGSFLRPDVAGTVGSQIVGVFVATIFFVIAGSMLIMRAGLRSIAALVPAPRVWAMVSADAVLIGATAFALAGGLGRVMLSTFASSLQDTGADTAGQVAALHIANLVSGAGAVVGGAGLAILVVALATIGRAAGLFGRPTSVFAWIAAVLLTVGFVGFAFLPVQFLAPPTFLVVAAVALRRSRRAPKVRGA